ncbi:MAG: c-type cytochrome [Burkholderiales bacterium]|nr:c-type cytochrome [Burkholderiales bacterium]
MKAWIKWPLIGIGALGVVVGGVVAYALQASEAKMTRTVAVKPYPITLRDDAATVERGAYLFASRGCADCHGANGGGRLFIDDPKAGMRVGGPNITSGGVVAGYKPEDWERTLRHGVKPNGQPVFVMPSVDYARWTDADVVAVVAYARQLPPRTGGALVKELPLPVRVLHGLGRIPDSAERIDHALTPVQPVPEGLTVEHGRYVSSGCIGCHGANLSGGTIPGAPPSWPPAANLTPGEGGVLTRYASDEQFVAMLRSGKRPDGSAVSAVMPFETLGKMSDVDLRALYLFLKTVAARPAGQH